ncbi:glycosyltransferase family 4 protein [Lutibacter sp.]|uniref:glycosyltransferase family 4 protein n=1 Tax=Lutibacter sp. TaxID=1925666 RepID=UPI00356967EB
MKITIITSPFVYIPPNGYGAVERIWSDMAKEMVHEGHQVTLLSKQFNKQTKTAVTNGVTAKYIKGYAWTGSLKKDLVLDFLYSIRALRALDKTDILVLNTFWSPLLCFFFKRKYLKAVYNIQRFPKGQFKYFKHIDRLSCVSSAVYNELIMQAPTTKSIANVISNPVNTEIFKYSKENLSENNKFRIVYTGRVHPEKGLTILVKACDLLIDKYPNIELVLVGPRKLSDGGGGDIYIDKLNNLATKFSIIWCDPISDAHLLKKEIDKSSIFCYPSVAEKGETFGVSPLEAMAAGRATVVSGLTCFKDFVVHGENGLIFNHKLNEPELALKDAIELLINNSELRNKLAFNGSQTALNFSNKKIANSYLKDFEQILNKK